MQISKYLRNKAEETIILIQGHGLESKEIQGAKGFFVYSGENLPDNMVALLKIAKGDTIFFICQQI